ncbi:hypothetical protein BS50DRAFT_568002 [Corynespora cassiicola Philippines]|uniref:Uncharacterized protein n=1 Tax=Corynespora cassiicola Philippines TaxID=1448308 RepID=A0A2T2PCF3_CORCC|nr:hypothetical protein BS50DRAFT_568002 [Corynespora cassiicola Philippines]
MYVDRWVSAKGRYDPEPFTIRVEDAWHDNDEMRRLFIGAVAGAVQAMSENDKNCQEYEKNGSKRLGCSIANRVRVRAQTDKRAYWLQVTFEAPDIVADFQCESSVRGVDKYLQTLMPEWQGQMWVPVNRKTHCTP